MSKKVEILDKRASDGKGQDSIKKDKLLVILPEIYGVNNFIKEEASHYRALGFEVLTLDYGRSFFYEEEKEAYRYFMKKVGFSNEKLKKLVKEKSLGYERVFLLGFSVGGSLAYRWASQLDLDGVVCVYGSRIRDYLLEEPRVASLIITSKDETYELRAEKTSLLKFQAPHGFMDRFSKNYHHDSRLRAQQEIESFLEERINR